MSFGFALPSQPGDPPSLAAGAEQKSDPPSASQENPEGGSALCRILALMEAAIAVPGRGLYGPGERPWARSLLFPGFGTGLFEFQPHPSNDDLLGEQGLPASCPHFPRGTLGLLGGHKVFELAGWWEQAGHLHDPKMQGTTLGPPRGDAGDKGPL